MADFIEEVIQRPVVLVGNSLGALVSLQAALDRPELVKGLLLVNPRFRQEHVAEAPPLARQICRIPRVARRINKHPIDRDPYTVYTIDS